MSGVTRKPRRPRADPSHSNLPEEFAVPVTGPKPPGCGPVVTDEDP
ncbi:hypothetical protein IVB18_46640 [Bradyrhizobium sp. 186]|nr:hypothetical protein [Bradyrhizobium sp. 186]UPK40744.1 hypothetical protein IVB18_46640 [Bradyrhizobium sp. 186]